MQSDVTEERLVPRIAATTMYHMHTFVASTCMHVTHNGGFRFNGGLCFMCLKKLHHGYFPKKKVAIRKTFIMINYLSSSSQHTTLMMQ